ncbi:MAG: OmpA family protein [Deltaproteobacteria bacterium]|nr:OmpA family protein [Deltaproteobacteria bacterium]NNK86570.1 OmpA family protein [Desulfobacterales bacterium]
MTKTLFYSLNILFLFACFAIADNLKFPDTEAEIIEILGKKINKTITTSNGIKYVSEEGRVYKIINGKRYTLRGIQVVEALAILPKAGALINFSFDSAIIDSASQPLLDEFGKALKNGLQGAVILIAGHTDSKGSNNYNQALSERRAEAVVEYLKASHGISQNKLLSRGFGETQPITVNDTEENRFRNRRVEFVRID